MKPSGTLVLFYPSKCSFCGSLTLELLGMVEESHTEWDAEEMDRMLGLALQRVRQVRPGSGNRGVQAACSELTAAHRLQRPNSFKVALSDLHLELDNVEQRREKRSGEKTAVH